MGVKRTLTHWNSLTMQSSCFALSLRFSAQLAKCAQIVFLLDRKPSLHLSDVFNVRKSARFQGRCTCLEPLSKYICKFWFMHLLELLKQVFTFATFSVAVIHISWYCGRFICPVKTKALPHYWNHSAFLISTPPCFSLSYAIRCGVSWFDSIESARIL